jgi:hypothetical protein
MSGKAVIVKFFIKTKNGQDRSKWAKTKEAVQRSKYGIGKAVC